MKNNPLPPGLDGLTPNQSNPDRGRSPDTSQHLTPEIKEVDTGSFTPFDPVDFTEIEKNDPSREKNRRSKKRIFSMRNLAIGFATLAAIAVVGAGFMLWFMQNNILVKNTGDGAAALGEFVDPSSLRGEGDGRVNILLIGIDDAAGLSDTIIVASIDPVAKDVAMLSVPRDMLVDIPGFGRAKVNAAHAYGEQYDYEGGGPQLLQDTLEEVLDIPIHYYGRVDFEGFEQAVDIVGGVEVEVENDLIDNYFPDERFGYEPFRIMAGTHVLDGDTALRYARSRYTTSDFDRSRRQQQILLGLKDRAISRDTLSSPTKIAGLMRSLSQNAQTNLSVEEIMRLVEIGESVNPEDIVQSQLDASEDNFLAFSDYYGQSVLVPVSGDWQQIQEYVRGLLVDSYIKDEAARISVLNGTMEDGLAGSVGELLRSFGYQVDNIDNASEQNYTRTVIFDYNGDNPYTIRYLEQRFGVSAQRRQAPSDSENLDIEIVIGGDYDSDTQ